MKIEEIPVSTEILDIKPKNLTPPYSWVEHIPFSLYLISKLKPAKIIELGVHTGNSFNAFCQIVKEEKLETRCFGVDHWKGDEHAGFYEEEVFRELQEYQKSNYSDFSRLMKMSFDEACTEFEDNSIDLLHIDGLHTYEAVRHDFENWLPKMTKSGVVLFHDICVKENNFGVWKFWEEIRENYQYFEFFHGYGLGVLFMGEEQFDKTIPEEPANQQLFRKLFEFAGGMIHSEATISDLSQNLDNTLKENKTHLKELKRLQTLISNSETEIFTLLEKQKRLDKILRSWSWRIGRGITKPARSIHSFLSKK